MINMRLSYGMFMLQTVVVHMIFLYSIFDIYFTSPLLSGMESHAPRLDTAPAERLVLFVSDGLRFDKCFEASHDDPQSVNMPFIRSIVESEGVWRVSHTRVPTESRPGHVAIIAGFYEDVSAVAKGWKENPVEFDSVFNRSRRTWAIGSASIISIFTKDNTKKNVRDFTYPTEYDDFAGADLSFLDSWVFDKMDELLLNSTKDTELYEQLHEDQTVIFLYLPGTDTVGHRYNPGSYHYQQNIQRVDRGIERMYKRIASYYGDNKTAFLLTSDHGMTEWGTHGAGHPHETLTPFVAWGSGIAREPTSLESARSLEQSGDILQADAAPFMASVLGLEFPVNNVGMLHPDLLSVSAADKAELVLTNTLQIVDQFLLSVRNKRKAAFSALFRPFPLLSESDAHSALRTIREEIRGGHFEQAVSDCQSLIDLALEGITYYHKYDRLFLSASVVLGFSGWMLYTICFIMERYLQPLSESVHSLRSATAWWALRLAVFLLLVSQKLPWTHVVYCLLPTFPFEYVLRRGKHLLLLTQSLLRSADQFELVLSLVFFLSGLELLVFSFFYRELLCLAVLLLAATGYPQTEWLVSCLLLMAFPLFPVVGRGTNYALVISSGICGLFGLSLVESRTKVTYLQMFLLISAILDVSYTSYSISTNQGLPLVCQIISWFILVLAWLLPMLSSPALPQRINVVYASFFTLYLLLSTSYEGWFLLAMIFFVRCWIRKEQSTVIKPHQLDVQVSTSDPLTLSDVRRAYFFLMLITLAFFGTGNIASLNSFEPASVFCFITAFSPFSMAGLMILKVVLPFVLVACGFYVITSTTNTSKDDIFLLILIMSDFMGLHFFMWVQDYGSWLDIGTSISHYVITLLTTLILIALSKLSQLLMSVTIWKTGKSPRSVE